MNALTNGSIDRADGNGIKASGSSLHGVLEIWHGAVARRREDGPIYGAHLEYLEQRAHVLACSIGPD